MTDTEQDSTWHTFHAFQGKIENKYVPIVQEALRQQAAAFIDRNMKGIDDIGIASALVPILSNIYYQCGYGYGYAVYKKYKNVKKIVTPEDIAREVLNELRLSLLTNVNGIEADAKDDILRAIMKGQQQGWGFDKTAAQIYDIVGPIRARRIVRTESVKGSNLSAKLGAQRTGLLMNKRWISARDKRTRGNPAGPFTDFDHYDMDGVTIPMDQKFFLGNRRGLSDQLEYPGDPKGQPADIINCRCVIGFVPRRDQSGRPVRTRPLEAFA